jgi:cell fate (sporulation/competence/biofilm development) regulator YmcA (YheA/YmcA/DUF963 family)
MFEYPELKSLQGLQGQLQSDPLFERYRELSRKLHQNAKILSAYDRYLVLQKEWVKLEHFQKSVAKAKIQEQMLELEDELYNYPLFNEYIQLQRELEELFQNMSQLVEFRVNEALGL